MKKIKKDSYLELNKYPQIIVSVNRLSDKDIEIEYFDEFRKYLNESVSKNISNDKNEFIIEEQTMKIISSLCFSKDVEFQELIDVLLINEFLIKNEDGTYSFNEEVYNEEYVMEEKNKFKEWDYRLKHIKYPWECLEVDSHYIIEGYSDNIQDYTMIASIGKEENDDCTNRIDLFESLVLIPWQFSIICRAFKDIQDEILKIKVKNVLKSIFNFNQKVYVISNEDEYYSFISNKNDDKLELLDLSKIVGINGSYEMIDIKEGNIYLHIDDKNKEELIGCIALIMHKEELFELLLDIANDLSKTNEIYKEIEDILTEEVLAEVLEKLKNR